MKSILVFILFLNLNLQIIKCQFAIPDEYRDAKDAIESDYYKDTLVHFFKDEEIPLIPRGGRIAGGEKAVIGQFPYHALLYLSDDGGSRYVCGGVLVKHNWILTAAHCIEGFSQIEVFLGLINRIEGPAAWRSEPITDPRHLIVHPNFEAKFLKNDIGLIFLKDAEEDLLLHDHIGLIDVPTFDEGAKDLIGKEAILSGFGLTEDGVASKVLKFAKLPVISNEECYASFPAYIVSSNLCTATNPRASPCQGDSGGPLTLEITPGRRIVVGLTSFGSKYGCTQSYPVGFQRVANHLIWLDDYLSTSPDKVTFIAEITTPGSSSVVFGNALMIHVALFTSFLLLK